MTGEDSKPPRGLFGYRRRIVEQMLEDRDSMIRTAENRVRQSEWKVQALEGELGSMKDQNSRLQEQLTRFEEQLDSLTARVDESMDSASPEPVAGGVEERPPAADPQVAAPVTSPATQLMAEELTSILLAGQDAAARMIERARDEAQRQIVEANRLLAEVHDGVKQFASWRADVQPVIARVQAMIDAVRNHIAQTPERVQHALAPLAEAMLAVDSELLELAGVCHSPFPESAEPARTPITDEHVEIPEAGPPEDEDGDESIWVSVEEDEVTVAESDDDQVHLETSRG
jgi:septal ring factor EnvC (AmiA/AmiB activator)